MGLAASQARLLLLTARKSDLEYRAQMICQRKVMLAMQTEELATNYSKALNNRKLYFTWTASGNDGTKKETLLTYEQFTAVQNTQRYRLVDTNTGKIACLSLEEASNWVFRDEYPDGEKGDAAYNAAVEQMKQNMVVIPGMANVDFLQDAINSGALYIEGLHTEVTKEKVKKADSDEEEEVTKKTRTWEPKIVSGMNDVQSKYYQEDDNAAAAEYEYQSLLVQNQDKQLDVELKQVETQQKACESEIDSVKKVLEKNIESSFKTFS